MLPSTAAEITQARADLSALRVGERLPFRPGYHRSEFGPAWQDIDNNGCNQRDDVLLRDLVPSQPHRLGRQGACDHDVRSGSWVDPYSGRLITLIDAKDPEQAPRVQIDHVVPLLVAWRYGADTWTQVKREQFANDLRNLLAVAGESNQDKAGSNAAQWRPIRAAQCGYAVRYVAVKRAYDLPTDPEERSALAGMLNTCGRPQ